MNETLEREVGFHDGGERKDDDNETECGGGAMGKASNSDSTSSSDSEEDEGSEELRLESLRHSLSENPANYDSHVQYIQCLRRLGHIEKLEQAREAMNAIFPLSSSMWREWAKDAHSINDGPEVFSTVEQIYEKGVHEYLSVSLWCDYLNFIRNHDPLVAQFTPRGVSKMRNLFERAIIAAGLHLTEGHLIWDAYKEFELAIYVTINDGNSEEKAKQIDRIRRLFHRQLAIPLADLRSTLLSYKHWEVQLGNFSDVDSEELAMLPANVVSLYRKALEMCNARKTYEDQLSKQNVSDVKLQTFMNYIKLEESSDDPARVQVLYERAIADFPIQSDLWLKYTSYVDRILKVPHLLKDVYSRSTRNCSWVKDLWVHYLLSLERVNAPDEELSVVFEKSLQCNFPKVDEYLDLFLTRIDGLRRRISQTSKNGGGLEYDLIRDTFQRAAQYLSPDMAKPEDILQLHIYWARVEVNLLKDLTAARGVWETLIKKSGPTIDVWQAYIDMETAIGNINEARSIYRRCYTKRFMGAGSEDICHSWLQFEREFGSLDDFDLATAKVMPRLEQLRVFREQQEIKNEASLIDQKNDSLSKNVPQKRKIVKDSFDVNSPTKRQKRAPSATTQGNVNKNLVDVYDTGKSGNLDVSASTMDDDEKVCETLIGRLVSKETIQKEVKQNLYTDQCTAFVSNLYLEANEEHIRKFFNDNGVTAIRLLKDKFTGKSRGLAYVDFIDQDHLSSAIAKNKQKLLGQKISIARSNPKRQKNVAADGHDGQVQSRLPIERENKEASVRTTKEFVSHRRGGHVDLKGKNTFAMPRSVVRPLGWSNKESNSDASQSKEQPKSNEEFRKMFSKE